MRRPLILLALIWATFVVIFPFAAAGDTSFLHIGSHLIQLALLGPAALVAWRFRQAATTRAQRALGWILSVTVPLAFACVLAELVTAIAPPRPGRLGQQGHRRYLGARCPLPHRQHHRSGDDAQHAHGARARRDGLGPRSPPTGIGRPPAVGVAGYAVCLDAIRRSQLGQDRRDVVADGLAGDRQALGDLSSVRQESRSSQPTRR